MSKHWAFGGGDSQDRTGVVIVSDRSISKVDLAFKVSVQRHQGDADSAIIVAHGEACEPLGQDAPAEPDAVSAPAGSPGFADGLLGVIPVGISVRDERGICRFANRSMLIDGTGETPGIEPPERGEEWEERMKEADRMVFATGRPSEYVMEDKSSGKVRWFHCTVFPVPAGPEGGRRVASLLVDITRQKLSELEANAVSERRREFLAIQREFISTVSHEFRTPMTTIQGAQYLLLKLFNSLEKRGGPIAQNVEKWLGLQASALATLGKLVDQVLMLNRTEHITGEATLERLSPADVLLDTVGRFNDATDAERVVFQNDVPNGFTAMMDPVLVKAAAENLISNGLKYSGLDQQVKVRVYVADEGWALDVRDQGRGIPLEDQPNLFRPFFRAANVGAVAGTGLGLAIVRRAVDFHGGQIKFVSATSTGTIFQLYFPTVAHPPADETLLGHLPLIRRDWQR